MGLVYYAANAGSDSNNGTSPATPFATLGKCQSVAAQGDVLNVNRGDTFAEVLAFTVGVTIQPYGSGAAPKIAPPVHTLSSTIGDALTFTNCGGITITGMDIAGSTTTYAGAGPRIIRFNFSDGLQYNNFSITNCTIHDGLSGIVFVNSAGGTTIIGNAITYTGNTVFNITLRGGFETAGSSGSVYYWSNLNVSNNSVTFVTGNTVSIPDGIYLQGCNGGIVNNNLVHDIGANWTRGATGGPVGIGMLDCTGITGTGNVIYRVFTDHSNPLDGIGLDFDTDCTNCNFSGNYIHDIDGPGIAASSNLNGNVAEYNVVDNAGNYVVTNGSAIYFTGTGTFKLYGNTLVHTAASPLVGFGANAAFLSGKTILNNALVAPSGVYTVYLPGSITGLVMDGNCHSSGGAFKAFYNATTYTNFATYKAATSLETNGVGGVACNFVGSSPIPALTPATIDLAYVFSPVAGSPLLNAGASLSGHGITPGADFLGTPWTQNTIGAFYEPWATTGPVPVGFAGGFARTFDGGRS
jgi:hypothetical protein